jgi:hypothetical protein
MAKIDKNSVLNYRNSDELIDFIAMNRYEAENQYILTNGILKTLPSFVQDVIFIIDFETEFEMQGLFTLLENTTGNYLTEISKSFYNTKNIEISTLISELNIQMQEDQIEQIEKQITKHILEKEFWKNVSETINENIKNCP